MINVGVKGYCAGRMLSFTNGANALKEKSSINQIEQELIHFTVFVLLLQSKLHFSQLNQFVMIANNLLRHFYNKPPFSSHCRKRKNNKLIEKKSKLMIYTSDQD